jgi:hypothetical protein
LSEYNSKIGIALLADGRSGDVGVIRAGGIDIGTGTTDKLRTPAPPFAIEGTLQEITLPTWAHPAWATKLAPAGTVAVTTMLVAVEVPTVLLLESGTA